MKRAAAGTTIRAKITTGDLERLLKLGELLASTLTREEYTILQSGLVGNVLADGADAYRHQSLTLEEPHSKIER
jgi:hypothetical protein